MDSVAQAPGFATILNAVQIGVVADIFLSIVPTATWMPARVALMFGGIVVTGIGSGFTSAPVWAQAHVMG